MQPGRLLRVGFVLALAVILLAPLDALGQGPPPTVHPHEPGPPPAQAERLPQPHTALRGPGHPTDQARRPGATTAHTPARGATTLRYQAAGARAEQPPRSEKAGDLLATLLDQFPRPLDLAAAPDE